MSKKLAKGGPKTKTGKAIAARNATTHGLTAKHWLSPVEEENYRTYLKDLTEDYQPQSVIEHTLIEKLADTKTRLDRFHSAEEALFALAHERASSSARVIDSFDIDDETISEALSDHVSGISQQKKPVREELILELSQIDLSDVTGWEYIKENMPILKEHILEECKKEELDLDELMRRYKLPADGAPIYKVIIQGVSPDDPVEEKPLDASGAHVPRESFIAYIKSLFRQIKRQNMIEILKDDLRNRAQLLNQAALPDAPSLDRLMRYRTTLERQFSKTLGELLHIINLRGR